MTFIVHPLGHVHCHKLKIWANEASDAKFKFECSSPTILVLF